MSACGSRGRSFPEGWQGYGLGGAATGCAAAPGPSAGPAPWEDAGEDPSDALRACLKPKAEREAKAKKAAKPKATKRTEPTKVFAAAHNAEAAAAIPGVRWASVVRATGALTAFVNCAEYGLVDAADKWMAFCVTHDEHEFHPTHRDAWTARRRSVDWCSGCRATAAKGEEGAE
ncbi:hypothetical protein GCM10010129_42240 [Streptomyces fumigatiscleroticus]|nr:hypothetical protein GCM10010129_42240 [Streptomyces fumigatiscleroticus]